MDQKTICNQIQNVLKGISWIIGLGGTFLISSSDHCVNTYFKHQRSQGIVLVLAKFVRHGMNVYFSGWLCSDWSGYYPEKQAVCETGGGVFYSAFLLPLFPFGYLLLRFRPVVNMTRNQPLFSELWVQSIVLSILAWAISNLGNAIGMRPDRLYWGVLVVVDVLLVYAAMHVHRWSRSRGESPTTTLYMLLFFCIFANCIDTLSDIVLAVLVLHKRITYVDWATGPVLFVSALVTAAFIFKKFKTKVNAAKDHDRIFEQCLQVSKPHARHCMHALYWYASTLILYAHCHTDTVRSPPILFPATLLLSAHRPSSSLQARPPKAFANSEFTKIWQSWKQQGREQLLAEAVLDAAAWYCPHTALILPSYYAHTALLLHASSQVFPGPGDSLGLPRRECVPTATDLEEPRHIQAAAGLCV
jgi:hypothetical protein